MGKKLPKLSLILKKYSIAGILRDSLSGYKIKGYFSSILQKIILHRSFEGSHFTCDFCQHNTSLFSGSLLSFIPCLPHSLLSYRFSLVYHELHPHKHTCKMKVKWVKGEPIIPKLQSIPIQPHNIL